MLPAVPVQSSAGSRVARRDRRTSRWSRPCRAARWEIASRTDAQIAAGIASRPPRSRRRSRFGAVPLGRARSKRYSAAVSNRPDRASALFHRDREAEIAFRRSTATFRTSPSSPRSARSSGSSPRCLEPPRSRRILASALGAAPRAPAALRRVSNPDQIPSEVGFSAPPRPPAPPPPRVLRTARSAASTAALDRRMRGDERERRNDRERESEC
ncbi:hypothetical protein VNO78_18529 [Psophocarpus tetragonolobus]|uniref:Uncharacterized protein n=1 Tax=Psophocarpus tetragonolobus TaxID=3891 RepID=A0AAN9SL29_PSOTE